MKLFKNPVFAVIFCALVIILSTCLNAKIKMEKKYDRVCDEVYEEIDEFAEKNGLSELRIQARTTLLSGDYDSLIKSYQSVVASGEKLSHVDDVDDAIRSYSKFLRKTTQFPASYFVELPFWGNPDSPGRLKRVVGNEITHDIPGDALVDECIMFEESGFYEENRGFFEHLRSGAPVYCDLEAAIQSVEIADCIRKRWSRYEG